MPSSVTAATHAADTASVRREPVVVASEPGDPLDRVTLAEYRVGDGAGELGFEACQGCDPAVPATPILTYTGEVLIADHLNGRWQIVDGDHWRSVRYPDDHRAVGDPLVGADGYVYVVVDRAGSLNLDALDPLTLDVVVSHPLATAVPAPLSQVNDAVLHGDVAVVAIQERPDLPTWNLDVSSNRLHLSIADIEQGFELPTSWVVEPGTIARLDDGTVVLHAEVADGDGEAIVARFWMDGAYAIGVVSEAPRSSGASGRFSERGWLQLDDAVSLYAIPEYGGPDALASWTLAADEPSSLDRVPRLLPADLLDQPPMLVRYESAANDFDLARRYYQVWARTGEDGTVSGFVGIDTTFGSLPVRASARAVEVRGWPLAQLPRMARDSDSTSLVLSDADRSVHLWGYRIDDEEIVRLAGGLVADRDGVGWAAPPFDEDEAWASVSDGWANSSAVRGLRGTTNDGLTIEMSISSGAPSQMLTPFTFTGTPAFAQIDGNRALVFERPNAVGITFRLDADLVVLVAADADVDTVMRLAGSLVEVDAATWESTTLEPDPTEDGCSSFFC